MPLAKCRFREKRIQLVFHDFLLLNGCFGKSQTIFRKIKLGVVRANEDVALRESQKMRNKEESAFFFIYDPKMPK